MAILVDSRVGSRHYADLLGDKALLTTLEYGDMAFESGSVSVGVECKRVSDAVNCLFSGRLADHQIPGLRRSYDIAYLIVEGLWRPEPETGVLQQYRGELGRWGSWQDCSSGQKRLMYSAFESWLSSIAEIGGVRCRSTPDAATTAALALSLQQWWGRDAHASYNVMHQQQDAASLTRPGLLRRMAAELPGIAWVRSEAVAKRFRTVAAMTAATEAEWQEIDGIGKVTAKKVVEALHEEE